MGKLCLKTRCFSFPHKSFVAASQACRKNLFLCLGKGWCKRIKERLSFYEGNWMKKADKSGARVINTTSVSFFARNNKRNRFSIGSFKAQLFVKSFWQVWLIRLLIKTLRFPQSILFWSGFESAFSGKRRFLKKILRPDFIRRLVSPGFDPNWLMSKLN